MKLKSFEGLHSFYYYTVVNYVSINLSEAKKYPTMNSLPIENIKTSYFGYLPLETSESIDCKDLPLHASLGMCSPLVHLS